MELSYLILDLNYVIYRFKDLISKSESAVFFFNL